MDLLKKKKQKKIKYKYENIGIDTAHNETVGFIILPENQHTSRQSHEVCCSHKVFVFGFNTLYAAERRGIKPST